MNVLFKILVFISLLTTGCKSEEDVDNEIIVSNDFQIAQEAYFNGEYSLSIAHYSNLIKEYPDVVWLYLNRGDAYSDNGDVKLAIKDYDFVINQNGKDKEQAMLKSALTYFYVDDFVNSEKMLNKITKLKSQESSNEKWSAYYHLGQISYKNKQYKTAIEFYNKADDYSNTLFTNYHKANAFHSLGDLDSAEINFTKSIEFVKRNFIEIFPESAIAKCKICGFPFGSKEYELLTVPTREGKKFMMKKIEENEIIQDVIKNPGKYLDTNYLKNNENIYIIE